MTPEVDPYPDLEAVAQARGWSLKQALEQHVAAEAVGAIATNVAIHRPGAFVGSALADLPGGPPTLYIKGPADQYVLDLLAQSELAIKLADMQPYSFEELEARKLAVHHNLEAQGFRNVATGVNIMGAGSIVATVLPEPGVKSALGDITMGIPEDLRSSVSLTIGQPLDFGDTGAYAGMWVTVNGGNDSTSGWTVRKWNGSGYVYGVTTAGHATNSGQNIVHPGHGTHTFVYQNEHRGAFGDVQWHTTNQAEEALFYASSSTVRNVLYLEARAAISINEPVCQYGRASNYRDCDYDVFDVSIACTNSGVFNDRLVQMDGLTSTFGDSGGPWFYDYKAFGSQKGHCGGKDAWTVADLYDSALGVEFQIFE